MKIHRLLPTLLLPLILTGCGTEHISERIYTQAIGLTGDAELTLYAQTFNDGTSFSAKGLDAAEAIRRSEAVQGGRVFIGHTELLCLDGSRTLTEVEDLLKAQGIPPACKLLYTQVEACFEDADPSMLRKSIHMAERCGLMAEADISTALDEWLGNSQTALLPAMLDDALCMVFLRTDGTCTALSAEASQGMYWLRRNSGKAFSMTVDTANGTEDVTILRSSLQKGAAVQNGISVLHYTVNVYTDECTAEAGRALQERILLQCRTAISEMHAAEADVIGMQALSEFEELDMNTVNCEVSVVIKAGV